ncbi:MAG: toxin-antitoxin system antitoxin subunit, partial [Spartobacteria bacterium]
MNLLNHKKWAAALAECDSHILRIQHALDHLADKIPLSKEVYDFLSDRDIAYIDQIVFRFSKLQDVMGKNVFPLGLGLLGEDIPGVPFIDLLNKLESLRIIPSAARWLDLRELRNDLTHEYPDVIEDRIEALNNLNSVLAEILSVYGNIKKIVKEKSN